MALHTVYFKWSINYSEAISSQFLFPRRVLIPRALRFSDLYSELRVTVSTFDSVEVREAEYFLVYSCPQVARVSYTRPVVAQCGPGPL